MAQDANTRSLYTRVRNRSGVTRTFAYLGAGGKTLAANEAFMHPGNLADQLAAKTSKREFEALQRSLDDHQSLEIISTPAVHLYDPVRQETQVLALKDGDLGTLDPTWNSEGSSDFNDDE